MTSEFKVIDSLNGAKMAKYSLVMTPRRHVEWLDALYLLGLCIHTLVYRFVMLESTESEMVRLISREIMFAEFQPI